MSMVMVVMVMVMVVVMVRLLLLLLIVLLLLLVIKMEKECLVRGRKEKEEGRQVRPSWIYTLRSTSFCENRDSIVPIERHVGSTVATMGKGRPYCLALGAPCRRWAGRPMATMGSGTAIVEIGRRRAWSAGVCGLRPIVEVGGSRG